MPANHDPRFSAQWVRGDQPVGAPATRSLEANTTGVLPAPAGRRGPWQLRLTLPIARIAGIWMPYGDRSTLQKVVWKGHLVGSPFFQPGLLGFVDGQLANRLLLLTEPPTREVVIRWALDQAGACYRVTIDFGPSPASAGNVTVRFSTERRGIHEAATRLLARTGDALAGPTPAGFFEPSFCTWYAWHGALTQESVERCARRARELGFGTLILDDGWQYDAAQRVGAVLGPWHRFHGDYEPSRRKFPDFRGHVERVRGMGLRFLLWIAPMIIGVKSRAHRRIGRRLLASWLQEGEGAVDPRDRRTTDLVANAIARLVRDYPIDGFKVDYDYALLAPGQEPYWVGPAYAAFVERLVRAVRAVRPEIEWNLPWNRFARGVTPAFRAVDVPFDPDSNRLFMANLRALTGHGALYSDPALWSPEDPLPVVHRHVVPSLFCVPSIGAPLLDLPPAHLDALRGWLGFYRRHQPVFNHGAFAARWAAGDFQAFTATDRHEQMIAAFSDYPVAVDRAVETRIINATARGSLIVAIQQAAEATLEDADGRRAGRPGMVRAGLQRVACPPGRIIRLRGM